MGKHKEKKRKSGDFSETAPVSAPTCTNPRKDQLQAIKDVGHSVREASANMESSTERRKKKQKRKHVSARQAEDDYSTEQNGENRKMKKKKKLKNEEGHRVEDAERSVSMEEPLRKKKKKSKMKEEDEAPETQSGEKSEELPTGKKKKKLKASKENIKEKRRETEEVVLSVQTETESKKKKKKKEDKSKDKTCANAAQSVLTTQESQTFPEDVKEESTVIAVSLLNQLKEFLPDINSKESINLRKMIKYDLPRFKEFKRQGIRVKHGRFTADENERLRKNVGDFMALTAIDSAAKLFFTHRYKQEHEHLKKLKGKYRFFERIAEGIPRPCFCVYSRGRRMFDEQNYQGEFSKDELHMLAKLHTLHGNNWKKISELTGRSALSLQKRYTQLAIKEGPWSQKETQRLLRAVRDHILSQIPCGSNSNMSLRVMKETMYKRLPLQKIALKVKTRSWTQCREKWMGILAVKMSFGAVGTEKKSLDVQVKLIKRMYEMDVDDAAHVNWEELTALIGDVPPMYLQRKWHKLKVCHVPEWQKKSFADIVDFLHENILAQLEQKLKSHAAETRQHAHEDSYLLSDIFQDINEDEDVEEDDEEEGHDEGNEEK